MQAKGHLLVGIKIHENILDFVSHCQKSFNCFRVMITVGNVLLTLTLAKTNRWHRAVRVRGRGGGPTWLHIQTSLHQHHVHGGCCGRVAHGDHTCWTCGKAGLTNSLGKLLLLLQQLLVHVQIPASYGTCIQSHVHVINM